MFLNLHAIEAKIFYILGGHNQVLTPKEEQGQMLFRVNVREEFLNPAH